MYKFLCTVIICLIILLLPGCNIENSLKDKKDILQDLQTSEEFEGWEIIKIIIDKREMIQNDNKEVISCTIESKRKENEILDLVVKIQKYKLIYVCSESVEWLLGDIEEEQPYNAKYVPLDNTKKSKIVLQLNDLLGQNNIPPIGKNVQYKIVKRDFKSQDKTDKINIQILKNKKVTAACELFYEFNDCYTCWCLTEYTFKKS